MMYPNFWNIRLDFMRFSMNIIPTEVALTSYFQMPSSWQQYGVPEKFLFTFEEKYETLYESTFPILIEIMCQVLFISQEPQMRLQFETFRLYPRNTSKQDLVLSNKFFKNIIITTINNISPNRFTATDNNS